MDKGDQKIMKTQRVKTQRVKPIWMWAIIGLVLLVLAAGLPAPIRVRADDGSMELRYDDGYPTTYVQTPCNPCGNWEGVRFSLPSGVTSATITSVRFYYSPDSSSPSVRVHIMAGDHLTDLTPAVTYSVGAVGWHSVDVPGVQVSGDFWVVIERTSKKGGLYYDASHSYHRSFTSDSPTRWTDEANGELMVRVTIYASVDVGTDQQYQTIQAGVDAAAPGVAVVVHSGTYVENVVVNKSLTIRSKDGPATTIVIPPNYGNAFMVVADGVTISGFAVKYGVFGSGIRLQNVNGCNIDNIDARKNYYGVFVVGSLSTKVTNSNLESSEIGIRLDKSSSGNVIYKCSIHDNGIGVQVDGANNEITGNDIHNNTGVTGSAIHLGVGASGNLIHFNKIVSNSTSGQGSAAVLNENIDEAVNALLNWWGNASGPSHSVNPSGTGDAVSDSVKFTPWLNVEPVAVKSGMATGDPLTLDAKAEASTMVIETGTGTPTIWVASYSENPGGVFPTSSVGKWIDVYFDSSSSVTQAEIRLYYTPDEITALNLKEGSLRLYWWDSSNSSNPKWVVCSDSGVNKVDHYVWARINATGTPTLNDLAGTPFTGGTTSGGFHWWLIPLVLIVLVVLAVAARLAYAIVIKGARPADAE